MICGHSCCYGNLHLYSLAPCPSGNNNRLRHDLQGLFCKARPSLRLTLHPVPSALASEASVTLSTCSLHFQGICTGWFSAPGYLPSLLTKNAGLCVILNPFFACSVNNPSPFLGLKPHACIWFLSLLSSCQFSDVISRGSPCPEMWSSWTGVWSFLGTGTLFRLVFIKVVK